MHLSSAQQSTLIAVLNRVIPSDEQWPGAVENGVFDYLAQQFEGDLRHRLQDYRMGLEALQNEAQARHQCNFEALDEGQQDTLLRAIEKNQVVTIWPIEPLSWFRAVTDHAAEGFYADPSNGSNLSRASWQMCGFVRKMETPAVQEKLR